MKLYSLEGNTQQLDGGAMFGNAPKALWSKWLKPDSHNRIKLACRCLLIRVNQQNILLETGIGAFFEPKLQERYGIIEQQHILLQSLEKIGLTHEQIDAVILSHLHFDHAGGLLSAWNPNEEAKLLFPNATFLVGQESWQRALQPHLRDKASFIPQINQLLAASNRLEIINSNHSTLGPLFKFHTSEGHTPGMLLTEIATPKGPLIFAADLIPGLPWMHLPITMGYDRYPEKLIEEKQRLLNYLAKANGYLFFTHDPEIACVKVQEDEQKRSIAKQNRPYLQGKI